MVKIGEPVNEVLWPKTIFGSIQKSLFLFPEIFPPVEKSGPKSSTSTFFFQP